MEGAGCCSTICVHSCLNSRRTRTHDPAGYTTLVLLYHYAAVMHGRDGVTCLYLLLKWLGGVFARLVAKRLRVAGASLCIKAS